MNDTHEFKPILAEIEDAPVSPLGRTVFWTLLGLIVFVIAWVTLGQVDVVITARGKVIPEGKVKVVQPLDNGVVTAILVKEGDVVRKGQTVMEIDPAITEPILSSTQKTLDYANLETERLQAMLVGAPFRPSAAAHDPENIATQMALYQSGIQSYQAQKSGKQDELSEIQEQIKAAEGNKAHTAELLEKSTTHFKKLQAVRDVIARQELENAEKDTLVLTNQYKQANHQITELRYREQKVKEDLALLDDTYRHTIMTELSERDKSRIDMQAKLKEVSYRSRKQRIVASDDGVIDQLFIHTVGGVVTPAEKLLTLVPSTSKLLIEAQANNKDRGYIRPDQKVTIKVDTFDYQKYGTLPGKVLQISSDSHPLEENRTDATVYTVLVSPQKTQLKVDGRIESLRPGMAVNAEIKVGKRRIIEFFIYPIIKSLDDSFKLK